MPLQGSSLLAGRTMEDAQDTSRWVVFYPVYINSNLTVAKGRRISKSAAVENPTLQELGDCCQHLKLPYKLEPEKAYSRDFTQRGRARVQLKSEDGLLHNPLLPTRKALMLKVADLIPKHPGRQRRQDQAASTSGPAAGAGKSGKGGKKKK